jgi:hypothetical protein
MTDIKEDWTQLTEKLERQFGIEPDVDAILFLIGVQELGKGYVNLKKDQKMDIMHVAICTLLSQYGYYVYDGKDKDGWPHFSATAQLPNLMPAQQNKLMREAIVNYFKQNNLI